MKAPTLSLIPLFAAAALAGCAGDEPTVSSTSALDKRPNIVVNQMPYKAGSGVVASWAATPSPAAGASGRVDPAGSGMLRLGVKMDDGTMQYVDTDSRDFPIGTRVQLTEDRIIKRP
ncbi:MAG: hypothetical protein ACT4P3_12575 [Betaproteobacteria bacterium]